MHHIAIKRYPRNTEEEEDLRDGDNLRLVDIAVLDEAFVGEFDGDDVGLVGPLEGEFVGEDDGEAVGLVVGRCVCRFGGNWGI